MKIKIVQFPTFFQKYSTELHLFEYLSNNMKIPPCIFENAKILNISTLKNLGISELKKTLENISKIIIHQGFTEESNNMQLVNDIALLRLEHPVNFTSNLHFLIRFDYHDELSSHV